MSKPIDRLQPRREVAYFMRRLYRQRLTTTSGGNVSVRLSGDLIAITPSQTDKGRIHPDQIALIGNDGANHTPQLTPSMETGMHLALYRTRPDVGAIVHAHPPTASAFTAADTAINCSLLAESYAMLGEPVIAPYALMGSPELAEIVASSAHQTQCILLQNHGVVALGATLLEAFDRLELVEVAARMTLVTRQLDGVQSLDAQQRREIDQMMGRTPDTDA